MQSQLNPYALSFEPKKHFEMSLRPYFQNPKKTKICIKNLKKKLGKSY